MIHKTFQFNFSKLNLDVSGIEEDLGYRDGDDREFVTSVIQEVLKEASEVAEIKAEYRIYDSIEFIRQDKSLNINSLNFQIEKIVFSELKKSDSIAVFVCTAGDGPGIRSKRAMQEGDLLKGYIFDVVGSEVADGAAELMQNELEKAVLASGKKITNRYSPGYCGWYVAEQHKLFQLLPDNFCGIKLTHSALMDPVKSVSGIIGIGKDVTYNPYTCDLCGRKDCIYRKKVKNQELSD